MALELESKIMGEIGLYSHYTWYNSSGSCRYIRTEAANKLFSTIQKHHDDGEEIAPPKNNLINTVKYIAEIGDSDDFILTKTYQAASYVIAEHIHQAKTSEEERAEAYRNLNRYLVSNFLPEGSDAIRGNVLSYFYEEE